MVSSNPRSSAQITKSKRSFSNNVPPGLHYLPPLDPKSEEFLEGFRRLLLSEEDRTAILALSQEDAKGFIEVIDGAFRAARLDAELKGIAFRILKKLCGRMGHLPDSYLLSNEFDLSGIPHASGGFSDLRKGTFKGKDVAVKSLRISELNDKVRIRKRFCKEVAIWKNLCHPNVLNLIGVPDTLEEGRFSMVSEWMVHGSITEYVRANAGNHSELLVGAVEGLRYLHTVGIVHGDIKGANILITNTKPVSACLADFGFMTIVHDPSLGMESSKSEAGGGTTPFMAPELLFPSRFKLEKCASTMEADVYAMAMTIYQVLTGTLPFSKQTRSEVVVKVFEGERPSKPTNALELGLSDELWTLLEDCWQTERRLRPPVEDVLARLKSAASACATLRPVGGVAQLHEDPESCFEKFDKLFLVTTPDDQGEMGNYPMERPPSQESNTSMPDSLFSDPSGTSEAGTSTTDTGLVSANALVGGGHPKEQHMEDFPTFL